MFALFTTRIHIVAFLVAIAIFAFNARGDDLSEVQKSIQELRDQQDDLLQQMSENDKVKTFLNDQINIGGFFDGVATTAIWGPETRTQLSTSSDVLALNLAAQINDEIRFNTQLLFSAVYPLQNPNSNSRASAFGLSETRRFSFLETTTTLPQAYMEYSADSAVAVQVGRGYVPFGTAFQQRDLALFRRRGGPQMLNANTSGNVVLLSSIWSGVHLKGSLRLGLVKEGQWGYDLYSITPSSSPTTIGAGARAWFELTPQFHFGFSTQEAKRGGQTYDAFGVDTNIRVNRLGIDLEGIFNRSGSSEGNPKSFYLEPYISLLSEKITLYGAVDYIDSPTAQLDVDPAVLSDPYERWEYGGGINWLPYHPTRIRLGFLYNNYTQVKGRNYSNVDLSVGLEF